jgi:thiol-disulfide isomerase/thioredoxin
MSQWAKNFRRSLFASACGALSVFLAPVSVSAADALTIGSDAPAINVEHWVQDGKGKFKPVTKFENDKVYVVEFWATWCGPCVASMPHLAQLQKEYADKAVQIVSISDEDLETVETFLEGTVAANQPGKEAKDDEGKKEQTYKDLTSAYCLTADPDRSCHKDYMQAAGQNGIPCAFIVGKDQKIEWIGHPMSMDDVLKSVVEGNWDRKAFAETFKKQQEMDLLIGKISQSMRAGKPKAALDNIDKALASIEDPMMKKQLKLMQLQIMLSDEGSAEKLTSVLPETLKDNADNPQLINMITWTIYEKIEAGDLKNKDLVKISIAAVEKAANDSDAASKAAVLDTLAHLQFLDGNVKAALATQEKAVGLAEGEMKNDLTVFLEELQETAKKAGK